MNLHFCRSAIMKLTNVLKLKEGQCKSIIFFVSYVILVNSGVNKVIR